MIKCNVTVCGTIGRIPVVRAGKEGKQFTTFGVNVQIPVKNAAKKLVEVSAIQDGGLAEGTAGLTIGTRVEVTGVLTFKKRGEALYLNLNAASITQVGADKPDLIQGDMHFRGMFGVNVTRVNRSGMDLFADPHLTLQVGDRVMVVGQQDAVERVAGVLGNQLKRLDTPNIVTIFVGIFLGILLGSLPIAFPGMPTPLKLGLAGGPLVVAILIGRFGHKLHLVTYTTMSANLMLREIGIVLFLASVGIDAGANFVQTVVEGDGLLYVGCGFLITVIPLLIIGAIARLYYKVNYFTLMGLIAGSNTDPPALAYANQTTSGDAPAVGYSTVYPLSMFLRILTGQMILLAMM